MTCRRGHRARDEPPQAAAVADLAVEPLEDFPACLVGMPVRLAPQLLQPGLDEWLEHRQQAAQPSPAVPRLPALLATRAHNPRAGAMWASRRLGEPRVHEMLDLGLVVPCAQRLGQIDLPGRYVSRATDASHRFSSVTSRARSARTRHRATRPSLTRQ